MIKVCASEGGGNQVCDSEESNDQGVACLLRATHAHTHTTHTEPR